jgi:predicted dinucleotide-binding enzyme
MKKKIAIIGKGNVGGALKRGLEKHGYEVKITGRGNGVGEAGKWGEILIFAMPHSAVDDALKALGDSVNGKIVVDVTNPLTQTMDLAVGFSTSAAEELQKKAPRAKVVKAFNTVFAGLMDSGTAKAGQVSIFAAGDDQAARSEVLELARSIGFDAIDAGPLKNARLLEPLALLNIQLGYPLKMGTQIGMKLVH